MPGPYTKGAQNAETFFALFDIGDVTGGTAVIPQNTTALVITHGLGGTPDFFLLDTPEEQLATRLPFVGSIGATTFEVVHTDTDGATQTVYYLAGVLS
jgi:hypothetical protein